MSKIHFKFTPTKLIFLSIILYIIGLFQIEPKNIENLKRCGIARQDEYTCIDSEGEEHEGRELINIKGIGPVITYLDVYFATIPFLIVSLVLAKVIFNSSDELRFIIYTNCVLGILLIWLTTKPNILSTILYWSGIIVASFALKENKKSTVLERC